MVPNEILCPQCTAANATDAQVCSKCGASLQEVRAAATEDPFVGTFVGQRFLVKRRLGEGGMGVVYEAEQTAIDRKVALKVLHPHLADETLYARFRNEAAAASRLDHPNTITVYDFGRTDNNSLYLAMEFVDGVSLDDEIAKGPMEWRRVCHIGSQICASLRNAHDNGIIHRDMKPENVMLCRRGDDPDFVKVLDFGIAKIVDQGDGDQRKALTKTGMVFGTPQYMSPEQVRGEKVDARSDIYSVGVILYQMLTGKTPFSADTPMGLLTKHLLDPPPPFSQIAPDRDIPPELEALVMRALSKEKEKRPADMKEFGHALDALVGITHSGHTTVARVSPVAATGSEAGQTGADAEVHTAPTLEMDAVDSGGATAAALGRASAGRKGMWVALLVLVAGAAGAGWWWSTRAEEGASPAPGARRTGGVVPVAPGGTAAAGDAAADTGGGDTASAAQDTAAVQQAGVDGTAASGSDADGETEAPSTSVAAGDARSGRGPAAGGSARTPGPSAGAAAKDTGSTGASGREEKTGSKPSGGASGGGTGPESGGGASGSETASASSGSAGTAPVSRCKLQSRGARSVGFLTRALRRRSAALLACAPDGDQRARVGFALRAGSDQVGDVAVQPGGNAALGRCVSQVLRGTRLLAPSADTKNGVFTLHTVRGEQGVIQCDGVLQL